MSLSIFVSPPSLFGPISFHLCLPSSSLCSFLSLFLSLSLSLSLSAAPGLLPPSLRVSEGRGRPWVSEGGELEHGNLTAGGAPAAACLLPSPSAVW